MSAARPGPALRALRVLAPLGALAMAVTIVLALASGATLGEEGLAISALVWGRVTFVDLGLALVLGWLWIAWRERRVSSAFIWLVLTTVTGSAALLVYVSIAAWRCDDVRDVLVGPLRRA